MFKNLGQALEEADNMMRKLPESRKDTISKELGHHISDMSRFDDGVSDAEYQPRPENVRRTI